MPDSKQKGPDLAPGQKLGNYTIVRQIGEGGMGAVYEANQAGINRRVALKVLPKALMQNQVFLERFLREAQSAGALNHPNIVTVYEVVQDKGHYFFSMEYVDGYTLREQLKRTGRMSADEALRIVRKVAQALHYAWNEARIIHRDIKPDNIMLTRQAEVKVADLGLAKSTAQDTTVTADGTGIGTPAYMSPEQSRGAKDIDCRADIYSLGITLFQMLTAQLPFEAETPYAVVLAHAEQPLPDPKSICPDIPDAVSALIQRMCAKDPTQRYETPGQLVDEIDAIARPGAAGPTQPVQTEAFRQQPTIPVSQRRRRAPKSRSRTPAVLAAVLGLAVIGGLGYLMFGKSGPGGSTTTTTTTKTTIKGGGGDLLVRAQGMFEYATEFAQKHPNDFKEVIDKFEEVRINAAGTVYAMKATDAIKEWRKKWDAAGDTEIEKRRAPVAKHLADTDFAKARAVWQDFPKDLLTDATREKVNAEMAKVEAAVRAFAQNLKRQAAPFLAKRPGQLTAADITTLTALKGKAERPPAGLDAAGKAALAALAGQIGQALAAYQEHLAALRAEALEELWTAYEPQMKGKGFDRSATLVKEAEGKIDAEVGALLAKDTPLVAGLFANVKENLPQLKGKTIRVGGMAMTVTDVKDGKVVVKQDKAEMAFGIDKLGRETILMLALMGEKDPGMLVRKKALFAFYYGRETEVVAKLKEAREAGADVAFYLSRLRPVLVVTSVPPGSSVAVEVKKDGMWQRVPVDAQKTPARCEIPGHGSYRVRASKKDYLTATREITVREVGELKLVFSLKKAGLWPPVREGLVLHYSFDQAGDRVEDLSGRGNHGTAHGLAWGSKGKVGGAGKFDGKNAYVETPHSESLSFVPNEFTVAAWIYPTAWGGHSGMNAIATKYGDGGVWLFRVVKRHETGNVAKLNTESALGRHFATREVTLDQWHFVVMRKSRDRLSLYLDGLEDAAFDYRTVLNAGGPLRISGQGPDPHNWGVRQRFCGLIDEFMVFNRALSEAEIRSLAEPEKVIGEEPPAVARYDVEALLAAGFEIPKEAKDKYGNPIRKGADATTDLPLEIRHKKTGMHLVFIPAGEFMMGSPPDEMDRGHQDHPGVDREGPVHRVRIAKPFYMGKYEVTQAEWTQTMGRNPSSFKGENLPAERVNWNECQEFTGKLNRALPLPLREDRGPRTSGFSLPTEAQWEYACRAGSQTRFYFGDDGAHEKCVDYIWCVGNSGGRTHPVGQKKPNGFGLHDMSGNVYEHCLDWYGPYPAAAQLDPTGPDRGDSRTLRGGSWHDAPRYSRSAYRHFNPASYRCYTAGCRLALSLPDAWRLRAGVQRTPPVSEGLLAYYSLDGHAQDGSKHANHGEVKGATPAADRSGRAGGALHFDGKTSIVVAPHSQAYREFRELTLLAWVRNSGGGTVVFKGGACPGAARVFRGKAFLFRLDDQQRAHLRVNSGRGTADDPHSEIVSQRAIPRDRAWHMIVGVFDDGKLRLYIDGRRDRAAPTYYERIGNRAKKVEVPQVVEVASCTEPLRIGSSYTYDGGRPRTLEHFAGDIDDVAIYDRALTEDEIKRLASPKPWGAVDRPPGGEALVLYYPFDKAGDRAEDKSGKANHGTLHGVKWTRDGKFGGAYEFDGKSAYIQRDYDERSQVFPRTTAFSAAAWFKTSASTPLQPSVLASYYVARGVGEGYHLLLDNGRLGGRLMWYVTTEYGWVPSKMPANDGRWHQAIGIWDGEKSYLYVDGVLQGSVKVAGPIPYRRRQPFRIGRLHNVPPIPDRHYYFNGTIDEVMVFNRALSAAQVKALHEWKPGRQ